MRLQPDLAVDHVAAGVLELARPADVGLLVEAGLDLDDHQHLLAGLGRVDQGVDDRGVARGAVERLLDREHVRVGGRLLDEPLHGGRERVVRVLQEDVAARQRLEHVDGRRRLDRCQGPVGGGDERRVLEVLAVEVRDAVQSPEVERPGHPEHLGLGDPELGDQQGQHLLVDRLLDLEPHGRAELAAEQLALQGLEQVLGVVLLDLEVLVAGDPERVRTEHLHAGEQPLEVLGDHVLQRHEPVTAALGVLQRHESAEALRHLHPREVLLAGPRVAHDHGEVERETGDVRERVGRVDGQRGQHREDALLEQLLAVLLLVRVEVVPAHQLDAVLAEGRHDVVAEHARVPGHQLGGGAPDQVQHLARHQPGRRPHGDTGRDPALEAGHAHHEELVEVAGEDRQEADPLQQRQVACPRPARAPAG